jgi:hypothetical protein
MRVRFLERVASTPIVITLLLTAMSHAASAHHAASAYDTANQIQVTGTVREFRWTNPHTWIYLVVANAAGKEQEWRLEGTSLVVLARAGWRAGSLKAGDRIDARIAPARSGEPAGVFSQVKVLATGVVLPGGLGPPTANGLPAAPGTPAPP